MERGTVWVDTSRPYLFPFSPSAHTNICYHTIPNTMQYHEIPYNTMQHNTMQYPHVFHLHLFFTSVNASVCWPVFHVKPKYHKHSIFTFHRHFDIGMFHYIDLLLDFFTTLNNIYHWNDWMFQHHFTTFDLCQHIFSIQSTVISSFRSLSLSLSLIWGNEIFTVFLVAF